MVVPRRLSAHQDRHRLEAAKCDRDALDPNCDRIATNQAFVKDLDRRAVDEAEFEETTLQFVVLKG